jgi:predicted GH43/DUF377 family glycosyl hydrolase
MKWRKYGQIFDPTEYNLPHNCFAFAKSPQAIVYDDFIRIYYSAGEKDIFGKILCHVLFVDFDKEFSKIIRHSEKEVISLGELGAFDEHGIFPFNVLKENGVIKAYTTGWSRRTSVSVETSIGYAESYNNGTTFSKLGLGPIFTATLNEPFLVCDGFVFKEENIYYMFYLFGTKWTEETDGEVSERVYKIALATSDDGLMWKRNGECIISNVIDENECQALPTVIKIKNTYHMYFSYRNMTGFKNDIKRGYRMGYAYSNDLNNWTRDDKSGGVELSSQGWDSKMICYPHIFRVDESIYMLYNGNDFGRNGFGLIKLIN